MKLPNYIVSLYPPHIINLLSGRVVAHQGGFLEVDDTVTMEDLRKRWLPLVEAPQLMTTDKSIRTFIIPSNSEVSKVYEVTFGRGEWYCPCKGFGYRRHCTHVDQAKEKLGGIKGNKNVALIDKGLIYLHNKNKLIIHQNPNIMSKITKAEPTKKVEATAKTAEVTTDKANVKAAAQKIQYERELKWNYPADCTTAKDRKVFRALNRGKIRRAEAHALKTKDEKEKATLLKTAKELRKVALMDINAEV